MSEPRTKPFVVKVRGITKQEDGATYVVCEGMNSWHPIPHELEEVVGEAAGRHLPIIITLSRNGIETAELVPARVSHSGWRVFDSLTAVLSAALLLLRRAFARRRRA